MKSGNLNFLEPSGPLQACNGTALPLTFFGRTSTQEDFINRIFKICFQTAHLGGPKNVAIARARIELQKIQVLLNDINAFSSQLLVRTSLLRPDHTAVNDSGI